MNVPILDDEYFKRRAAEHHRERLHRSWKAESDSFLLHYTNADDDKNEYIRGLIDVEELERRTELRWRRERR